jgi:DNA-binding response OmpR family regulator
MARILLIDDEESVIVALRGALAAAGHQVMTAVDGDQGLRALRRHPIDIIVTDIVMPGKEGIETILEIRRLNRTIPIIAMSEGSSKPHRMYLNSAVKLGATRTLTKPFPTKRLLEEIDACLGRRGVERVTPN